LFSFLTGRIVGGRPLYLKFWAKLTPLHRKRRFFPSLVVVTMEHRWI